MQQIVDLEFLKACFKSVGVNDGSVAMFLDVASKIEIVSIKKYGIISKVGELCECIGLVKSGLLRVYYMKNGREVTEGFVCPGRTFTSVVSFFSGKESNMSAEAEEDTVYYRMPYADIEALCKKFKSFDLFFQQSMIATISTLNAYSEILQLDSADEKYEKFCEMFPDVVLRVPSIHIASCLGITPETLSRVRGRRCK